MAHPEENRYGIREIGEGDVHGEMDVWLEKLTEVVNRMAGLRGESFELTNQWDTEGRLRILGRLPQRENEMIMLVFGKGGLKFPDSFRDLTEYVSYGLQVFMGVDETWDFRYLLKLAVEMESEKKEREEALVVIGEAMGLIFESEASQEEAEKRVLQQWAEALSENGWIVSGTDLRNLTRLPILGKDSVLIYHGSPRYHPHYLRVSLQGGVKIEGISATRLSQVPGAKVVSMESLETDEINIVATVLAAMAPRG